jgi:serine/threonine protein kinase/ABC-type branched-subunit amino acid transport system substrate-binding protein
MLPPSIPGKPVGSAPPPGKFRFIAEIGRGGMSEVFLTLTQSGLGGFQKLVVVKLLRGDLAEDADFRRMFLEEARLTARLNHPNVVQTNDVGEDLGRYYIAMEYLEGQTFERTRRARNANTLFPLNMRLQMLVDVLSGLHYAHELTDYDNTPMGIVHRDVTPSNVFITYDGQVKLVDFGIAKVMDSLNQTRVGVVKGKARYMAPEQIMGSALDRRADIFSVGVMLWEILAAKQIWHGRTEQEILRRVSGGDLPSLPSDVPPELQQICLTAMAPQARDRYATADALRADLESYLAHYATPSRERGLGAAVSELFSEERLQIRQLIEAQMRGVAPSAMSLPVFHRPGGSLTGSSLGAGGSMGGGSMGGGGSLHEMSTGSRLRQANQDMRGSYSGQHPPPPPSRMSRKYAIIVGAGVAAVVIAVIAFNRGKTAEAPPPVARTEFPKAAAVPPPAPIAKPAAEGATARGVTDDTITVGMSAAFSGASRELGNRMKLGLETAFATINEGGGIGGRSIKLMALDDGYDGKRALTNVQELINDRNVFAILGNVGTPTTKEALPFVLSKKVLFFGAFTGSGILRRDPPDRYVFNYRASYEEETAKMINYLIDVKKISDHGIVVFAQNDSYGDAGFDGASKTLRKKGRSDELLRVGYDRNTLDVDDAVNKVAEYHNAAVRLGNSDVYRPKHPVKAIIMVGTYKAAAKFIQKIRDRKIDAMFLNVSFVGSDSLAEELKERGPGYGEGVIVTQVVPHFDSGATGIIRYREAMKKYHPDQQPDFVSLEGFVVGQLFAEGLRRVGHDIDTETLIDSLEQMRDFDPGIGGNLSFGMSQHQASHKVWGTVLDAQGAFKSLDMD